jgi:hypothetical protein
LALTQPFTANLAAISCNDRCPACAQRMVHFGYAETEPAEQAAFVSGGHHGSRGAQD